MARPGEVVGGEGDQVAVSRRPFTAEEDTRIRAMRANDRSWAEIAARLGRSQNAVYLRGIFLGLPGDSYRNVHFNRLLAQGRRIHGTESAHSPRILLRSTQNGRAAKPGAAIDLNAGLLSLRDS